MVDTCVCINNKLKIRKLNRRRPFRRKGTERLKHNDPITIRPSPHFTFVKVAASCACCVLAYPLFFCFVLS